MTSSEAEFCLEQQDPLVDLSLVNAAARLWENTLNTQLRALQLSAAGLATLQALLDAGTTNQASLARLIKVQPQTLRHSIRSLELVGYLVKNAPVPGVKGLNISITAAGKRALSEANRIEQHCDHLTDTAAFRHSLIALIRGVMAAKTSMYR